MLRLFDISSITQNTITFTTEEIEYADNYVYVMYDTSTGYTTLEDYYGWRTQTYTSTGMTGTSFYISNATLYPKLTPPITNYSVLTPKLFYCLTFIEYSILVTVLDRLDLVRKRLPNPGAIVQDSDGIGDGGVVSVAGGYDKKFAISELMNYIEGALIEINIHPPATNFYWNFTSIDTERNTNPYTRESATGIPYKFFDLIVQGAIIRALMAWGILEIDLNFTTTDAGLQITYDRVNNVASWTDRFLVEYTKQKELIKWDCVNSGGVGIGSIPFSASAMWGAAMNMIGGEHSGVVPLTSMLGFASNGNIPL